MPHRTQQEHKSPTRRTGNSARRRVQSHRWALSAYCKEFGLRLASAGAAGRPTYNHEVNRLDHKDRHPGKRSSSSYHPMEFIALGDFRQRCGRKKSPVGYWGEPK